MGMGVLLGGCVCLGCGWWVSEFWTSGIYSSIARISTVCLTRMPKSGLVSEFWGKKTS